MWFRSSNGLISALQTDQNHYGHGYGLLVTKAISKKIAEMGTNPCSTVYEWNTPSRRIFEKLGYKEMGSIFHMFTKRKSSLKEHFNVNATELIEKETFTRSNKSDYSKLNDFQHFSVKS